jgi:hypothetical protein
MHQGPVTADYLRQPAPGPAAFGLPSEDDGSRNDPLVGQNMPSCPTYRHDFDALRAASTRIVVAVGEDSAAVVTGRAAIAVAERLGSRAVTSPVTTAVSWAVSTARRASRTPSPPPCGRS